MRENRVSPKFAFLYEFYRFVNFELIKNPQKKNWRIVPFHKVQKSTIYSVSPFLHIKSYILVKIFIFRKNRGGSDTLAKYPYFATNVTSDAYRLSWPGTGFTMEVSACWSIWWQQKLLDIDGRICWGCIYLGIYQPIEEQYFAVILLCSPSFWTT